MDAVRKKSGPAAAHQKDAQAQQAERGRSRFRNGAQGVCLHLLFCQNRRVQIKLFRVYSPVIPFGTDHVFPVVSLAEKLI